MTIISLPRPFQTAFREARFVVGGLDTPETGLEVEIRTPVSPQPLGVKRIWAPATSTSLGSATINAAPYARTLLAIEPLCRLPAGATAPSSRLAPCQIAAPGERMSSAVVNLTGGTVDAPQNEILSAGPSVAVIGADEKDEISVITPSRVAVEVIFTVDGTTHTDRSMGEIVSKGMITVVVDAADVVARAAAATDGIGSGSGSAAAAVVTEFLVRLRLISSSGIETWLERQYVLRSAGGRAGRRLAWVNRYGAVDYHTFPVVDSVTHTGSRTTIDTPAGVRTVATAAARTERLISEPCAAGKVEWLAEILSSPAVWSVDGSTFERVKVADGKIVTSPLKPTHVSLEITPATQTPSRK